MTHKYSLADVGIVRAMRGRHALDLGPLLENLVYLHFHRMGLSTEYVLASDGSVVDFITHHQGRDDYSLFHVCLDLSNEATLRREVSALRKIGDALDIPRRLVVTWNDERLLEGDIEAVPVWRLLMQRL